MNPHVSNFFGTYTPRLDDKARLFLPARFRPRLEHGIVLTRGQENCIYGWTTESFNAFTDRVRDTPFTNQVGLRGSLYGATDWSGLRDELGLDYITTEEVLDKQGRISIPPVLREWAHLDRDCTVVGAMDRIEIWDSGRWTEFSEAQEGPFADMSEEVMPGIF